MKDLNCWQNVVMPTTTCSLELHDKSTKVLPYKRIVNLLENPPKGLYLVTSKAKCE